MTPVATFQLPNGRLAALFNEPLNFTDEFKGVYPITMSLDPAGQRGYCHYSDYNPCNSCPFHTPVGEDTHNCQHSIIRRHPRYLQLFGITADTHPEYFI